MHGLFLRGLATTATHIVFTETGYNIAVSIEDGDKEPTPQDVMDLEWYKQNYPNIKVTRIEARQTYYWLPLDCYNQPRGYVDEVSLFPSDYSNIMRAHTEGRYQDTYPYYWIYSNEQEAFRRAID